MWKDGKEGALCTGVLEERTPEGTLGDVEPEEEKAEPKSALTARRRTTKKNDEEEENAPLGDTGKVPHRLDRRLRNVELDTGVEAGARDRLRRLVVLRTTRLGRRRRRLVLVDPLSRGRNDDLAVDLEGTGADGGVKVVQLDVSASDRDGRAGIDT